MEDLGRDLRRYMLETMYAMHPRERQTAHWVMSEEWLNECRKAADASNLGIPAFTYGSGIPVAIEVRADAGAPKLEAAQ
jgi:hypothetical protein